MTIFDDGYLRVDLTNHVVSVEGKPVDLTREEYGLLAVLVRHPGKVLTNDQVQQLVWGSTDRPPTYVKKVTIFLNRKLGWDVETSPLEPELGLYGYGFTEQEQP